MLVNEARWRGNIPFSGNAGFERVAFGVWCESKGTITTSHTRHPRAHERLHYKLLSLEA